MEAKAAGAGDRRLAAQFVMALEAMPYLRRRAHPLRGGAAADGSPVHSEYLEKIIEEEGLYASVQPREDKAHPAVPWGLFWGCFKAGGRRDTQNLDTIVHTVFLLMTEGISPQEEMRQPIKKQMDILPGL